MELVFHEKQDGQLCAQHCLNTLLQGPYFTAIDLSDLARQLDEEERLQRGPADNFQSSNFDDAGFFSVEVIKRALSIWNLEVVAFQSSDPRAQRARNYLENEKAFICNFREHWFTIRRIGQQWFNCNSLLTSPELVSNTMLNLFLTQLETEGYSIHIVFGELPLCPGDQLRAPVTQSVTPSLISGEEETVDEELKMALEMSRVGTSTPPEEEEQLRKAIQNSLHRSEEDLELAIALSLHSADESPEPPKTRPKKVSNPPPLGAGAQSQQQQSFNFKAGQKTNPHKSIVWKNPPVPESTFDGHRLGGGVTRERQSTPDADEVRRRRLAFLDQKK